MPVIRSGVRSIAKAGSTQLKNDVTLTGGANVTLTQSGQDISIAASSSGGGATTALDNLASVAINTALLPGASNSIAIGATGSQWSDLFLGEGAVIEWDGGDATLTQTGNDITFGGITSFGLGTGTAVTLGTIELGHASDTTLSQTAPGVLAVEGVNVLTVSNTLTGITNKTLTAPKITNSVANAATSIEFNGTNFISTPITGASGVSPSTMFANIAPSGFSLQTTSGLQNAFPAANDVWTFAANTAYYFEGQYRINHTTTTCTVALGFPTSGGGVFGFFGYSTQSCVGADGTTATASNMTYVRTGNSTVVTITSTANFTITFQGMFSLTASGTLTITPQINFSANTTAPLMQEGSYIFFTPIGADTTRSIGSVA